MTEPKNHGLPRKSCNTAKIIDAASALRASFAPILHFATR